MDWREILIFGVNNCQNHNLTDLKPMRNFLLSLFLFLCLSAAAQGQNASSTEVFAFAGSSLTGFGQDESAKVIFYPNPVKRVLNVRFPHRGTYTVTIYNIVGEKIMDKTVLDDFIVELDLVDLPKGMFFLNYEYGGRVVTKTFSKI